jgi:hypothetical protein
MDAKRPLGNPDVYAAAARVDRIAGERVVFSESVLGPGKSAAR